MLDFLTLRRIMLIKNYLTPIEHRYFIAFLIDNTVYISGIKFENWLEDYPDNRTITIPDTIEINGIEYPTIIDSDPYYREGMEV